MSVGVVIVAAGSGQRAGGAVPKQLQILGDRPVFEWSVAAFIAHPDIGEIVLVVQDGEQDRFRSANFAEMKIVAGGSSRTASVQAGLNALMLGPDDIVLIHDAARPGVDGPLIDALLKETDRSDAAAPALDVIDALKRRTGSTLETVARDQLHRIQTPQAFRYGQISAALSATSTALVDDLAAIEAQNRSVGLVPGSERLAKITFPGDLERMEKLLTRPSPSTRIGSGFDVHGFEPGAQVTLCGVSIPHSMALKGHSDADVAWHALTDAILGACALGDIGDHFPPSDPQWAGAASSVFLKHAVKLAAQAGYQVSNCDLTIICEAPKVKPHREAMRISTAALLGLSTDAVSVKATTTEGLGFTGRNEGIAAQAVAVLSRDNGSDRV